MKRSLVLAACCSLSLFACDTQSVEGPARDESLALREFDEVAAPSLAGPALEALEEKPGQCPPGFALVPAKREDPTDTNQNGYVCSDGVRHVDDMAPGTCPFGFEPESVVPGEKGDQNVNGIICTDGRGTVVDDVVKGEDAETEFVGGHGNFITTNMQDISFSFHGKQNKQLVIKGEFEMHDQTNGVRIHGDVTCLRVEANQARLGGTVTQSTDPKLPVGAAIVLVSRPSQANDPKNDCHRIFKMDLQPIIGGNIQVLH